MKMRNSMSTLYRVEAYAPVPVSELIDMGVNESELERFNESIDERGGVPVLPMSSVRQILGDGVDSIAQDYLLWDDDFKNLVVNEGLDDALDKYFKGSTYTAAHYVGLTDGTPAPAAGDELTGTHAGWTEITAYTEANRPSLVLGSVSGQSVDNTASKAEFTITANDTTMGGAFVCTDNTKGGSEAGVLYGVGAFSAGDKTLDTDDTLNVTVTLTASAST